MNGGSTELPMSFASGIHRGRFNAKDGHLYLTGHDNTELYVVDFPKAGSVLKWIATIPISAEGGSSAP